MAETMSDRCQKARSPNGRARTALILGFQLPAVLLLVLGTGSVAWWLAALWGSATCCLGTDSRQPWRNRALLVLAVLWLLVPTFWPLLRAAS